MIKFLIPVAIYLLAALLLNFFLKKRNKCESNFDLEENEEEENQDDVTDNESKKQDFQMAEEEAKIIAQKVDSELEAEYVM